MSEDVNMQIIEAATSILQPSSALIFLNQMLKTNNEFAENKKSFFTSLFKALSESKQLTRNINNLEIPLNYFDFLMCADEQFQDMIHVTRKTAKTLIQHIRGIPIDMDNNSENLALSQNNEPIDKMLFLVLWYFRNDDKELADAVGMFELGNIENANKLLNRGVEQILKLKADSGLLWPTAEEFTHSASCIQRRFSFPNVGAVMGHRIFKCKDEKRLMLQTVCNEKHMFIDAYTSYDTRPRVVFNQSMLKNKIQDLNDGLVIISEDFNVPNKYKKNIIVPYNDSDGAHSEKQLYNIMHEFVLGVLTETFNYLLTRFPKLKALDRCEPEIVMAACVLHNYCIKLNDLTPL